MLYVTLADQRVRHSQLKTSLESALAERHKFSGESSELRQRCIEYVTSLSSRPSLIKPIRLEAQLKEAESRLTEQRDRERHEDSLLNELKDSKGLLSTQGKKLEESEAEKGRLRDLVEHANLKYVYMSSWRDRADLDMHRAQDLTHSLQVGIAKNGGT